MPVYTVLDNETDRKVTFQWDGESPPTETEMIDVFSASREIDADKSEPISVTESEPEGFFSGMTESSSRR